MSPRFFEGFTPKADRQPTDRPTCLESVSQIVEYQLEDPSDTCTVVTCEVTNR